MSHNDAEDYAQRLYARVPSHYRVYDQDEGEPLLALLRVVGRQVANLRRDLDDLWDNFFIETCDDWVVPYIAALVGTNLLANPVGQSNRLDVWRTVLWRRSKGTPAMLRALAGSISGWPADEVDFFQTLGWSQNVNHLRLDHPLTPDLRDPGRVDRLGHADDPFAHAADFRRSVPLEQARVTPRSLGIGRAAWGTPGRHQIKNLGFFVRTLMTFKVGSATPAASPPGLAPPADASCFTFDPLFRDAPLFVEATRAPLTRAGFQRATAETFGSDVVVRQFGVPLAGPPDPTPSTTVGRVAFTFGDAGGAGLGLDATAGIRLLEPRSFERGGAYFLITAGWFDGMTTTSLGVLSTLHAARGDANAYQPGSTASGPGRLVVTVETGHAATGWPALPPSPGGRFPGAVVAVRAARTGATRSADGLYIYLPTASIAPGQSTTWFVADDGTTYTSTVTDAAPPARPSEGQVYPARTLTRSVSPASEFTELNRADSGLRLADPSRFGGAQILVRVDLFTGAFQPLGAIATADQPGSSYPDLNVPATWPAFRPAASRAAIAGNVPERGLLAVRVSPLAGTFVPAAELIVSNRRGQSLLVYLPEIAGAPGEGVQLFVADDGSTYFAPADETGQQQVLDQDSYSGLPLARAGAGQVLPIAGVWPLQQRIPVAINLCHCERSALLKPGEMGIDPELGRFALPPLDPAIGLGGLDVDYVEAFGDRVGARTFDRRLDPAQKPSRLIAQAGDAESVLTTALAGAPIHTNLADALAQAIDGDVIEIVDSATYPAASEVVLNSPTVKNLVLRAAAGQRPCLTFYGSDGTPLPGSLRVASPMDRLELNGLLISGGPIRIDGDVGSLGLLASTLDPLSARGRGTGSLMASSSDPNARAEYLLCRCIAGGLWLGAGVGRVIIADTIVDQQDGLAIGGIPMPTSPPGSPPVAGPAFEPPAGTVQLERATVLGRVRCDVLQASECILDQLAVVDDQQAGCIRFSRYERGSVLPRRYQCVPTESQASACPPLLRCLAPVFNSRRFGRPDYAQLAAVGPTQLLAASQDGSEIGAFDGALNPIRLANLETKLREFLPVGLTAQVIAET